MLAGAEVVPVPRRTAVVVPADLLELERRGLPERLRQLEDRRRLRQRRGEVDDLDLPASRSRRPGRAGRAWVTSFRGRAVSVAVGRHRWWRVPCSPSRMSCSRGLGPSVRPACGLRLPAATGSGHSAPGPAVALLGRRVQRPVRVVEVRAAERAEVGAAGQHDRVHVVVRGDHADRDRRDADLVADRVGVRGLVGAPELRPLVRRHLAGRDVDRVGAVRRGSARAISTASSASMPPSTQSVAEMRTVIGRSAGPDRAHGVEHLERDSAAGSPATRRTSSVRWFVSGEMKLDSR